MKKGSILLVEDEELLRDSLTHFLTGCGFDVTGAEDEVGAMRHLDDGGFNIVITDLMLSSGSGLGVIMYAHENRPDTSCIVITGHGTLDSAIRALRKGACDYILKPFSYDQLKTSVEKILNRQADEKIIKKLDFQKVAKDFDLTRKEIAIVKTLMSEGLSNDELAARMDITRNTVKVHLRNIFRKVGVESKAALTARLLSGGK